MVRVGILTFSYSENSGSLLQAYALQETINKVLNENVIGGGKTYIINYNKKGALKPTLGKNVFYGPIKTWNKEKIKYWIHRINVFPKYIKKHNEFRRQYLNLTKRFTRKNLSKLNGFFDFFIVGSDQVWNYNTPKVDDTFFLDFVEDNGKKNSYAASFGNLCVDPSQYNEKTTDLLKGFHHVSTREASGQRLFFELTGKGCDTVLDPSLLFHNKDWSKIAVSPSEKKYIILYLLEANADIENAVKSINGNNEYRIIRLWRSRMVDEKGKDLKIVSPQEWLGFFQNAECIFTNSFHGICFSIIFNKEFYVSLKKNTNDSRLIDCLKMFSLTDRIIAEDFKRKTIDYEPIDDRLEIMRNSSIEYIKEVLTE